MTAERKGRRPDIDSYFVPGQAVDMTSSRKEILCGSHSPLIGN